MHGQTEFHFKQLAVCLLHVRRRPRRRRGDCANIARPCHVAGASCLEAAAAGRAAAAASAAAAGHF